MRVHRNRKAQIVKGSKYTVTNTVEMVDVDNDGAKDFRLTHTTYRDGQLLFEAQNTWYGFDPLIAESYAEIVKPIIGKNLPIKNFGELVKHYKLLAKNIEKFTDVGKLISEGMDEAAE